MRTLGRWLLWVVLVGVLLGISLLTLRQQLERLRHPDLPRIAEVPSFQLVDPGGRQLGLEDLKGAPWVAALFSTRCPEDCPPTLDRLATLGRELSAESRTRLVALTLDPQHDTPAVLRTFARKELGPATPPHWWWLTGDPAAMQSLLREGVLIPKDPEDPAVAPSTGLPAPGPNLVLVDSEGWIRGYYDAEDQGEMVLLRRDLESLSPR